MSAAAGALTGGDSVGEDPVGASEPVDIEAVLVGEWAATPEQAAALLGPPEGRYRRERLLRLAHLLLGFLWSPELARDWPTLPNRNALFEGRSPVDYMIERGEQGIADTVKMLLAWTAGNH